MQIKKNIIIDDLAEMYLAAERQRSVLDPIDALCPDLTLEDAYNVQMEIVERKVQGGDRVVGKKVGATNEAVQKAMNIHEPIYGHLLESHQVPEGGCISTSRLIHPRIECEIAFKIKENLEGPGITVPDVLEAVDSVMASLEINDARTREWKIGTRDVIADNGVAANFVLGTRQISAHDLDLPGIGVVLKKNGEEIASSTGAAVLGDPARSVAWLANKLSETNSGLKAGEVVLTGSLTPLAPVTEGDRIEAIFEEFGRVSVQFT